MAGLRISALILIAASLAFGMVLTSSAAAQEPLEPQFSVTKMQPAPARSMKTGKPVVLVSWLKEPAHSQFVPYTLEVASFRHLGAAVKKPRVSKDSAVVYSSINSCVDAGLLKAPLFANEAISCEELAPEMPKNEPVHIARAGPQSFTATGAGAAE